MSILCKLLGHKNPTYMADEWETALTGSHIDIETYEKHSETCLRCGFLDERSFKHRLRKALMIKSLKDKQYYQ